MSIPYHQIMNLMNSKIYQDKKHPVHKQVCVFVDAWFQNNADKLDENNNFKENMLQKMPSVNTPISDDELIKRNIPQIKHYEGVKEFPYKDTKGIITVAGGLNVNHFNKYASLNWIHKSTGQKATLDEIKTDYEYIKNAPSGNYKADFYKGYTNLRLSNAEIDKQMMDHLKNDLIQIHRTIPNFDKLPTGVQDAVIDIQYNTGHIEKFPKFLRAIQDKNVRAMVEESHRKAISENRNWDIAKKILLSWC